MQKYLRKISLSLCMLILISTSTAVAANSTAEPSTAEKVQVLQQNGIISGKDISHPQELNLADPVSRAEAAVILSKSINPTFCPEPFQHPVDFSDVSLDAWYLPYINYCRGINILSGYPDGTFQANRSISQGELIIIMTRALDFLDQGKPVNNRTTEENRQYAAQKGLLNGLDGSLSDYGVTATREMAFVMNYNLLKTSNRLPTGQEADSLKEKVSSKSEEEQNAPQLNTQAFCKELVAQINQERANQGIHAVTPDKILTEAAQTRLAELKVSYSHLRPDQSSAFSVLPGKIFAFMGENIAKELRSPIDAINYWKKSNVDYKNIINPNFTVIGVAYDPEEAYWEIIFASYK